VHIQLIMIFLVRNHSVFIHQKSRLLKFRDIPPHWMIINIVTYAKHIITNSSDERINAKV
jgi:hypothetical protein